MKLSKNLGRIATTFLATAMLASVAAVPAFAAENTLHVGNDNDTVTFTKSITKDAAAGVPKGGFVFTVTDGTGDADTQIVDEDKATEGVQILAETDGAATIAVDVAFDLTKFTEPGIYTYTLQETSTDIPGMTVDSTAYTLTVVVVNKNAENPNGVDFVIDSAKLSSTDVEKTDTITDTYNTYSMTLSKELAGGFANKNDEFTFDITFKANDTNATSFTFNGETQTFVEGEVQCQVTLKGGQSVVADGLPVGVTYTIVESGEASNNYDTTVTGNGVNYTHDATSAEGKEAGDDVMVEVEGESTAQDVNVLYTNTWDETSVDTGIVMDIAPYALLVVAAAAGCFVFLRKRRED